MKKRVVAKFCRLSYTLEAKTDKEADCSGSSKEDEIPEVDATFAALVLQAVLQSLYKRSEMGMVKCRPHVTVGVLVERVQIAAQRPGKQHWILICTCHHSVTW